MSDCSPWLPVTCYPTPETYAAVVLLAAYFIRGIAGFGSGLVAVPLLALRFPLRWAAMCICA